MCSSFPSPLGTLKMLDSQSLGFPHSPPSFSLSLCFSFMLMSTHTWMNGNLKFKHRGTSACTQICTHKHKLGTHTFICAHTDKQARANWPHTNVYPGSHMALLMHAAYVTTHIQTAMHVGITRPGSHPPSCREQVLPLASGPERQPSGAICQAVVPAPPILPELRQSACRACSLSILPG